MRHSHECHLLRYWITLCNCTGRCVHILYYFLSRAQEAKNMHDSETRPLTRTYSCRGTPRSAAIFTRSTSIFFSVLGGLSRLKCFKLTFDFLVYPGRHVSICWFRARNGTGRYQLEVEPAVSIIAPSTLVASREVIGQ